VQSVVDSGTHAVVAWHIGGTLVTLALAPSVTSSATLAVALDGSENNGVAGAVTVSFTPRPGSGMQAVLTTLAPQGQGEYGATLPLSDRGTWAIGVDVALRNKQRGRFNASVTLPLQAAQALLARTDQVTNRLRSMVMQQVVTAGQPPVRTRWEFQAPDRMHYLAVGDIETYRVGTIRWDRHVGGRWQTSDLTPREAFRWPDSRYAQEGWDAVVIGHDKVAGQSCAVVTFWDAYPNATFRLWIDQRSGRTLRLELLRPGGFEYDDFADFNAGPPVIPPGK
jgi:hypothetical protein